MQLINLYFVNVKECVRAADGKITAKRPEAVAVKQIDPRTDILIYDRLINEEQFINASSLDPSTHLIKSNDEFYYILHFETVLR